MSILESEPTLDASRPRRHRNRKRTPCPRPFLPERATTSDSRSCFPTPVHHDPTATLMLMQMIADSYEDRRLVWEANKNRERRKGDEPALYGPINDGQRKVQDYLVSCRFLSRPPPLNAEPEAEYLPRPVQTIEAGKAFTLASCCNQSLNESKCNVQQYKSGTRAVLSKRILYFLQKQLKHAKKCQHTPFPMTVPTVVRSARPALPRIVPSCKSPLRRMTTADTRALIASSVRQNRIRRPIIPDTEPVPEIYVAPELRVPGFRGVDYDDFKTLVWPQTPKDLPTEPTPSVQKAIPKIERKPPPFYISLIVLCLLHMLMFSIMAGIILAALWTACATVVGFVFALLSFVASLFLPSAGSDEDCDV